MLDTVIVIYMLYGVYAVAGVILGRQRWVTATPTRENTII